MPEVLRIPTPTTTKKTTVHTGTVDLPGLDSNGAPIYKAGFSEQADLVRRWENFRELLETMTLDQILDVVSNGPQSLVAYLHILIGGRQ